MSRRGILLFFTLGTLWGSSYTIIKVVLRGVSPLDLVTLRVLSAAVVLGTIAAPGFRQLGAVVRNRRLFLVLALSAPFSYIIPYLLITWGELHVSSALVGMLNSTTPIFTAVLSPLFFVNQRLGRWVKIGVAVSMVGVAIVLHPWSRSALSGSVIASVAVLIASACYGLVFIVQKRYLLPTGTPPLQIGAVQLLICAPILLAIDPGLISRLGKISTEDILGILVLGVANTALAAYLSLRLTKVVTATVSSAVTYVIFLVAVSEGVVILGEPFGLWFLFGSVVTLLGLMTLLYGDRFFLSSRVATPS